MLGSLYFSSQYNIYYQKPNLHASVICGPQRLPYLLEVLITVDVLLVMGVLQLVGLDVLPEGLDDAGASLSVDAEQASQARVQFKLGRLRR